MSPCQPRITTILPTYQRPQLLRRAIESVLSQTVADFILHIHDNASQDETSFVVEEYQNRDARIRYFRREVNVGLVENFALALDHVSTPFFSFLCDDDYLLPCFYETTLLGFERYPEAGFSAGRTMYDNVDGRLSSSQFRHPILEGFFASGEGLSPLIDSQSFPVLTGILFRTDRLNIIGGLYRPMGEAFDLEFTLRYAAATPIVINSTPCAVFTQWQGGASAKPAPVATTQFELLVDHVMQYFAGSAAHRDIGFKKLCSMRVGGYRHIWMHSLIANHTQNAMHARQKFLEYGGYIPRWKLFLLTQAETSVLTRKLFQVYFLLSKVTRRFLHYPRFGSSSR